MKANIVPSYKWLRGVLSLEKLPQFMEYYSSKMEVVLAKLQSLGEKFDLIMLKALSTLGKHALGRELSEGEKAKFMFFIHKIALICFIAGYLIGYFVSR